MKLLPIALLALFFVSCKKEGCTNPNAINYSIEADKDNGTCSFEASSVIWVGESTATQLVNNGATSLNFYVDGELVGTSSASFYFTSSPSCGQTGAITITKSLGSNSSGTASYSVEDQTGFEHWSGTLIFNSGTCEALELVW